MAKKYPLASKFLKVGGVGEGKLLLRSFLPPQIYLFIYFYRDSGR